MSLASCSFQCGFIAEDVNFLVSLLGNQGDLQQRYSGDLLGTYTCVPNWDGITQGSGPVLRVILMESDPTITQATLAKAVVDSETTWYVDGLKLEFNAQGLSVDSTTGGATGYAGCFRRLLANTTNAPTPVPTLAAAPFGGLEIRKNLAGPAQGRSINVSVNLGLSTGSKGIHRQGSTRIIISESNGRTNFAYIYCDNDSFVLDQDNEDVECKVRCFRGDQEVTSFHRKWYLLEGGQWVQKATTATFTVDRDMVATFADVKVECYADAACTDLIASDVQTVNDSTDAYIVSPGPVPADATFTQGGTTDVKFYPKLTDNDGNPVTVSHKFVYAVMDSVGNIVANNTAATGVAPGGYFTVTAAMANNMGEGPIVNITAEST